MFNRIKFGAAALLGLLLGIALALPLFWYGVKKGVAAHLHSAHQAFARVEKRQQAMSDEVLRLEKRLAVLDWRKHKADFVRVELLRSRLAGNADIEDKIEVSQDLERALLEMEKIWAKARSESARIKKDPFVRGFGLNWEPMKRYLVDEEMISAAEVREYNHVLRTWPVPLIVEHRSFASLLNAIFVAARSKAGLWLEQGWNWVKWGCAFAWAKVKGKPAPEAPKALKAEPPAPDRLFMPLPEPFYIAEAPKPEEDYAEIQYNRPYPNMADVEVGEDAAVLENEYTQPYAAPTPRVQKTVTYR